MTAAGSTDLYAGWVGKANEAAAQLRQRVIEAKHNEEQCCDVLNHALEAVMSLEHAVCAGRLKVQQRQQLPDIFAAILSNIQLAQSVVQVNGRHWQLASCVCVPWSSSSRRKLSNVSNNLENIARRTRELQAASLEELIPHPRPSGRSSGQDLPQSPQDLPQHSGLNPQQQIYGEFNTESVQAMKDALSRFRSDKEFEPKHQRDQEQLAHSPKPTPPRPSFSQQIRASFDISGLPNYERVPKSRHVAPDSAFAFKSHSVHEFPSNSGQIAAGLPTRHHTIATNYVPALLVDKVSLGQPHAQTLQSGRPTSIVMPQQMGSGGKLLGHLPVNNSLLSAVVEGVDDTMSNSTVAKSARVNSMPADVIQQSSLYAPSQSPVKVLSTSAAVQLAQKSASLSRRASLAAKLHRLAEGADTTGVKASECGSPAGATERNSIEQSQIWSMPRDETTRPRQRDSLDKVSRADCDDSDDSTPSAQQTSNEVDSKAADVRRQCLLTAVANSTTLQPADSPSHHSPHSSSTGTELTHARTVEEPGTQAEHVPGLRRTLSDAAAQALDVVESMQCPIIPYSQLQIQRKLGDGSIGQVYLAKWQETDVAVKVITQMQNLSSVQGIHPQDPVTMSEDRHETLTSTVSQMGLSDVELTAITTLEREVSIMAAVRHPNGMLQLHSHPNPILHCDLKSPNLLVDKHWRVKVTDFNLSSMVKSYAGAHNYSSAAATNPRWLAPEDVHDTLYCQFTLNNNHYKAFQLIISQVVMHQQHSKAADVYSFGIVLWELMTWQVPWDGYNHFQIMFMLAREQARPEIPDFSTLPGPHWSGIKGFVDVMKACWHQEPDKRPAFENVIASLRALLLKTFSKRQRSQDAASRGGSGTYPDSPRQLTAEAGIPWASSVTTLSRSGSSHSHIAHTLGSDPKQEIHPKHAPAANFVRSPFEIAVKQMPPEQVLKPSSDAKQETTPKQSTIAGSMRSPFEAAAKQIASEQIPSPSSDSKQETVCKDSSVSGSMCSPFQAAVKQMVPQQIPNPSSHCKQETIPKHAFVAGSTRSPFEAAAKQTAPEHIPKPVRSPSETTSRSKLQQLAADFQTAQMLQVPFADAQKADDSA